MGRIRDLRGIIIRNLTPCFGKIDNEDEPSSPEAYTNVQWETKPLEQRNGVSCFFSLHSIDPITSIADSDPFYTSTLCPHLCNPSWTDVDFNDFELDDDDEARDCDHRLNTAWDADAYCMRVWVHRPCVDSGAADAAPASRPRIWPRYAPWRMLPSAGPGGILDSGPPQRNAWPLVAHVDGAEGRQPDPAAAHRRPAMAFENALVLDVRIEMSTWTRLGPALADLRVARARSRAAPLPRHPRTRAVHAASERASK